MTLPAVLLHGFAGTGRAWDGVRAELGAGGPELVTPDLPGHGAKADERPISLHSCVRAVLDEAPAQFVLCGYSMGGRVALHVALAAPERVRGLVLVATTAGIDDASERVERVAADERLAQRTEAGTIEDFIAGWTALPLFAGTAPDAAAVWRDDIARNSVGGLAAALRGAGTGAMAPLWDRLGEIDMPALVLVGERDERYTELGTRLAAGLPRGTLRVVSGAGHGLAREAPAAVADALGELQEEAG